MPPRRRSERTKKEAEADVDATEIMSTPTKKRRRLNGSENAVPSPVPVQAQPVQAPERVGTPDSAETKDIETEKEPLTNDEIIANLQVGRYTVNASVDLNNDLRVTTETMPAYAKIAGRDWALFMKEPFAWIGRADRPGQPLDGSAADNPSSMPPNTGANFPISIDLGPSREVSRVHAQIEYNSDNQKWIISVEGRNGLKLDDKVINRGERVQLRSGAVITILGTQMMFILPNEEAQVHPKFKQQALADPGETSTDDETRKRRRNGAGFSDDRQFTELDPFPPSSIPRRSFPISHQKPRNGHQDSIFRAAAFAGAPQPATPSASRGKDKVALSPGSGYSRGVMLESTEEVDYSADAAKDLKPPHSYAQLIGQAILSSPDEMLTLANIYQYIREKYSFYRESGGGWQNSIRHNLSLSKAFEKVARRTDEPGKGMKWKIVDDQRDEFIRKTLMNGRRGTARMGSSGPNSPAAGAGPSSHPGERIMGVLRDTGRPRTSDSKAKSSHRSVTPPPNKLLQANEAYTPERGSRLAKGPMESIPHSVNGSEQTRTPVNNRRGLNSTHPSYAPSSSTNVDPTSRLDRDNQAADAAAVRGLTDAAVQSPPPLYGTETGRHNSMVTPLVARQAHPLAPPSTAQAPSQFMLLSSPAPFWKFADYGSTPARPDFSPTKTKQKTLGEEERELDSDTPDIPLQPSSPPVSGRDPDKKDIPHDPVSPSKTLSRPVSRKRTHSVSAGRDRSTSLMGAFASAGSSNTKIASDVKTEQAHASNSASRLGPSGGLARPTSTPVTASAHPPPVGLGLALARSGSAPKAGAEESEEEGIDLAKGFQKIGSFHQNLSQSQGTGAVRAP